MILGRDIHPERKIYYLGALILEALLETTSDKVDFFDVYQKVRSREKLSINLYALTLDWLFILGKIDNKKGVIQKCS